MYGYLSAKRTIPWFMPTSLDNTAWCDHSAYRQPPDGPGACSTAGSAILLRDWLCRQTRRRREPAKAKCGRRAICSGIKGLTAVNLARVEEFETAGIKLDHQERGSPMNGGFNRPNVRFTTRPLRRGAKGETNGLVARKSPGDMRARGAAGPRWANHPVKFPQTIAGRR